MTNSQLGSSKVKGKVKKQKDSNIDKEKQEEEDDQSRFTDDEIYEEPPPPPFTPSIFDMKVSVFFEETISNWYTVMSKWTDSVVCLREKYS